MVDGATEGWRGALAILKAYLAHFPGGPASVDVTEIARPPADDAAGGGRRPRSRRSGLTGLGAGDPFETPAGAPALAGCRRPVSTHRPAPARHQPPPALVEISGFWMPGAGVQASVSFRFFGDEAEAAVAEHGPEWQRWITAHAAEHA